ncbi:MAG: hypothetical protein HKL80_06825 [Acidimicrobiales bacterium]|nr:hypothetical protein [Acidimicrobiales bacterium]
MSTDSDWYSVRCIFYWIEEDLYEERITLWKATSFDEAIELAEKEANEYSEGWALYLLMAQCYHLFAKDIESGAEIFSLCRSSDLEYGEYLDQFFDTGEERQVTIESSPPTEEV